MRSMTVGYSKALAIALLVVGVLLLLVSLLTSEWIGLFAGAILTLLGVLQLINPLLKITPDEVRVCNPLGMTIKRFAVSSPGDLVLDGTTLRHVPSGKKVASLGIGAAKGDVADLRSLLTP